MVLPGVYSLAQLAITTALTAQAQTAITGLDGAAAVTIEAEFAYGSGGTSVSVVVQTRLGSAATWRDVARFDFTAASATKFATLSAVAFEDVTTYAALDSEGVTTGILGPDFRAVVSSDGTYADTSLAVRVVAR